MHSELVLLCPRVQKQHNIKVPVLMEINCLLAFYPWLTKINYT